MGCIPEVAPDTSALGRLLDPDSFDLSRITASVRRWDVRIILVQEVLAELYEGGTEHVTARYANLRRLCDALPSHRVGYAASLRRLLRAEQRGERFASTPVADRSSWPLPIAEANDPHVFARGHAERREKNTEILAKDEWESTDASAREALPPDLREEVVRDLPTMIAGLRSVMQPDRWPICFIAPDDDGADPDAVRRRLAADTWRARAHATLCAAMWLCATGAVLRGDQRLGAYGRELRWDRGNWSDARIAANAAYCPVLLTSDARLRAKVFLLNRLGLGFTTPMSLDELPF